MKSNIKDILVQDPFVEFYPEPHKYYDLKRKCYVARSVSDVVKTNDFVSKNMEQAAIRGTAIHEAAQIWCETKDKTLALAYAKEYRQWIEHLINYRMWDTWDCVANELRMVDRKRDIAGSLDAVLQHKDTGMLCLADFKTQVKYRKKNHRLQIGGYVSLLYQNYPSINLFSCRVIYITPDGIKTQEYNPAECMYDYEEARNLYFKKASIRL